MTLLLLLLTSILHCLIFPRANVGWLAWFHFIPLLMAVRYQKPGKSFLWAWLAGGAASLYIYYWIYITCRTGGVGVIVSVIAWVSLSFYVGIYWGLFAATAHFIKSNSFLRPFLLACLWTALEWLRTHFLSGFPWLLLGTSQWASPRVIQAATWGGVYAVGFFIFLVNALLAQTIAEILERRWNFWAHAAPGALFCLICVFLCTGSLGPREERPAALSVALVQGNIDQYKKWDQAYEDDIVKTYSSLTDEAAARSADLIIWPETAVPGWLPNEAKYMRWVEGLAKESKAYLLVGASSRQKNADYNAAFLLSPLGDAVGLYRKIHLVPFGEVVPFQKLLSRWVTVLNELGNFTASDERTVMTAGHTRFSVNICFESLFPNLIRQFVKNGAGLLINITNDGWFLDSPAAEQHFIAAVFRAVENRVWFIQVANTGFSGIIDPWGRVVSRTELLQKTVLTGFVGRQITRTFYTEHGDVFAAACATVAAASLLMGLLGGFANMNFRKTQRK